MDSGKLNLVPTISTAALPSTPANEWATRTNDMLAGAQGMQSPSPHIPGAFPESPMSGEDPADASMNNGETLVARAKASLAGYFGVVGNGDAQGQGTHLSTSSSPSTASSFSSANIAIHEADSPRQAGYTSLGSSASLDVLVGSTQSLGIFAGSTQSLASTAAIENAPHSPNIPPAPHPTPMLGSRSSTGTATLLDESEHPYLRKALIPVAGEPGSLSAPLPGDNEITPPFTPIPPVIPSQQDFPSAVPIIPPATYGISNAPKGARALLTHAGTHANGHTDAEEAQRAAFTHTVPVSHTSGPSSTANGVNGPAEARNAAASNVAQTTTADAAGHVFTAHGVHVPATLGAAQLAHAGAFLGEGNHHKAGNATEGNDDEDDRDEKREGKTSCFVAKLKGKMHVG
ncbi:hypothetical protein MVEN_00631100 [Mycena venus]|uniref:Uncharacterized protein n=1 Tax=Mycena venus TaxID=2733690 RepID=A0A8H6YMQ7_9AGAR|nr:hypothetical protein MVEN_00631100 [Mycena venus]